MASETTFDHWKVVFLMSKSEKKGPEAMKPPLRHSICQHDLKTVKRTNFRPEMAEKWAPLCMARLGDLTRCILTVTSVYHAHANNFTVWCHIRIIHNYLRSAHLISVPKEVFLHCVRKLIVLTWYKKMLMRGGGHIQRYEVERLIINQKHKTNIATDPKVEFCKPK